MKKRSIQLLRSKERELLGKSLFALKMADAGYSVVIGKRVDYLDMQNIFKLEFIISKEWVQTI